MLAGGLFFIVLLGSAVRQRDFAKAEKGTEIFRKLLGEES